MHGTRLAAALVAAGFLSAPAGAASPAATYDLDISGTDGTAFRAACTIFRDEGPLQVEIEGTVGASRSFAGTGLDCMVTQTGEGSLAIQARSPGGSISRSRTGGPNSTVRLRLR